MLLAAGTRLGTYEIIEPLGAGGMGEVYRARDIKLGREVAVKVLPEAFVQDRERVARFEREAKLLASLNHPNIATLYGLEESEDTLFLAMELVEGMTLAETIAGGAIVPEEALPLFAQIAGGLEAAHARGVIHRDLKPANIKVTPDGKIKILDFGLAKAMSEPDDAPSSSSSLHESPTAIKETASGMILGTAPYMSPEQCKGKPLDRRADLWAFGCVLYEALTGKKAFHAETVSETLAAILKDEPRWDRLPADTPGSIRTLLRRCLRKDAARRLHDAADVRIEIEDALAEPVRVVPGVGSASPPAWRRYVPVLVALFASGVALWALLRVPAPRAAEGPIARFALPLGPSEELFLTSAPTLAMSDDGQSIAYVASRGATTQLYLRQLDELDAKPVGGAGATMPFFSPDGQWLGFAQGGKLMKVSVRGGAATALAELAGAPRGASWSSEGIVFVPDAALGLHWVGENGGETRVLRAPDRDAGEKSYRFPELLPGDKAVLFTVGTADIESWDDASVGVLSLETGEYRVLLEGGAYPRYSATGHLLFARDGSLYAVPFDRDRLEITSTPVPVLEGVVTSPTKGPAMYALSRNGSFLYARGKAWGTDLRVVTVDRDGTVETLIDTPRAYNQVVPSPDGSKLAIGIDNANADIWMHDIVRGTTTRFISGFNNMTPLWTPDGERISFYSDRHGAGEILWQAVDGSDEAAVLVSGASPFGNSWHPSGSTLSFARFRAGTEWDIWTLDVNGEHGPQVFLATEADEEFSSFSPDGRFVAYESDETGTDEIYLRTFPDSGTKSQVSTDGGTFPIWSPDGREIFYRSGNKMMAVSVAHDAARAILGKPQLLFERDFVVTAYSEVFYQMMPDGEHFVMVDASEAAPRPRALTLVQNWSRELEILSNQPDR